MSRDRARLVRAFVRDLSAATGVEFRHVYEAGAVWRLEWTDGPTPSTVMAALAAADLAGVDLTCHRSLSARAVALGALRSALDGAFTVQRGWRSPADQVEAALETVEHPERPATEREEWLTERLLAEAANSPRPGPAQSQVCELLTEHGVAWLIGGDDTRLSPVEVLTARYATGAQATAWRNQAVPMSVRTVVERALADPELDASGALAALTLLRELRVEQEQAEAIAAEAARRAGATWTQIGGALGITKQSAAKWAAHRSARVPSRAMPRPSAQG